MMRHGQSCVCLTGARMRPSENSLCIGSGPVIPIPAGYTSLARLVLTMRHAEADTLPTCPGSSKWPRKTASPFDAIETQFRLDEAAVIALMRQQLKSSYTIQQSQINPVKYLT